MTETIQDVFNEMSKGNRAALGRAITIIESRHKKDKLGRLHLLERCSDTSSETFRIGITGAPGVGKSSLIELIGLELVQQGHRVAVLAIDPSSTSTGGSILGDKTRMTELSKNASAFIRPSPSSGLLGGVSAMTRETIMLCEAAGYDRILIETVGVGQSETSVSGMVDQVVFATMTGAGDGLQGIKRGILEVVDLVAINKVDGNNVEPSKQFSTALKGALSVLHGGQSRPEIFLTSTVSDLGVGDLMSGITRWIDESKSSGQFTARRANQLGHWFEDALVYGMDRHLKNSPELAQKYENLKVSVARGDLHPVLAAEDLIKHLQ